MDKHRRFSAALRTEQQSGKVPVIPDLKCRSPKEGDLLRGRDPEQIAKRLAAAGAGALSVVTETSHFGGSLELLQRVALAASLPVLRKDFISSRDQLLESVDFGASAVLLITSMLEKKQLIQLFEDALIMGLEPLVETHNQAEILAVNELKISVMGINNRDILELETDDGSITTTESLISLVRPGVLVVSESSISSPGDVRRVIKAGANAVLVGTAILKAPDPAEIYRQLAEPWGTENDQS